ncbi:MAG: DNA primase [Bacillota bacterium]|jgi:DNA primase
MNIFVPPQILDEIIQKTDIVELVSEYLTLKKQGKNFVGLCPFHSENTPSFSVSPEKQIYYCFGCQKGGNVINFVMETEGLTLPEAAEKLAERLGIAIPEKDYDFKQNAKQKEKQDILRIHQLAADFYRHHLYGAQSKVGANYCAKRGLGKEIINAFAIGYAPENDWQALGNYLKKQGYAPALIEKAGLISKSAKTGHYYDKFHGRLIFPICDYRSHVIAFGGRIIGEGQPKYINSTQTLIYNKSHNLYAIHIAASSIRQNDLAIVMEGYMDVIMAHQNGVTNAVASLGTALTAPQARLLKRYTTNVLLAYDGDSAGTKAAQRGLEVMSQEGLNIRILPLPRDMDPDAFLRQNGKAGWDDFVQKHSLGVLEYLLKAAEAKYPAKSVTDKGLIIKQLIPAISKTSSHVERDSFIRLLAHRLEVEAEAIYADLAKNGIKISNSASKTKVASKKPIIVKSPSLKAINPLFSLLLQDKESFYRMRQETGYDFCRNEEEKKLVELVESLGDNYDWQIVTLLHILPQENEGLRQLLLNLLQAEVPLSNSSDIIDTWIKNCKLNNLQKEILILRQELTEHPENCHNLLKKISTLQRKVQKLKS